MRFFFCFLLSAVITGCSLSPLWAQELAPRAYIISPVHSNAVTLADGRQLGFPAGDN